MSNDKKTESDTKQPAWMTGPNGAKAIPVRSIRIPASSPNVMELPGHAAARTASDDGLQRNARGEIVEPAPNKPRTKIHYLPWLGCFRIDCYRPSDEGLVSTGDPVMVPREWCHWTPSE